LNPPENPAVHPSELELHGHAIGALGDDHSERVQRHAATCAPCAQVLAAIGAADERARSGPRPQQRRLPWVLAIAVPAAAIALLVPRLALRPSAGPDLQVKGGAVQPALELFARRGGEPFAVAGTALRAGDEVRFVVHAPPGLRQVMIVSVEAGGDANLYYPFGAHESAALPGEAGRAELPGAIVLDASPGPERVFALFSRAPLAWADAQRALMALGQGGAAAVRRERSILVKAEAQASFLFEKAAGPGEVR
jgi:hypothetical protein